MNYYSLVNSPFDGATCDAKKLCRQYGESEAGNRDVEHSYFNPYYYVLESQCRRL